MIPKVKFKIVPVKYSLPLIYCFLNLSKNKAEWDWSQFVYKKYPSLKKELSKIKDSEKKRKHVEKYFLDFEKKNKNKTKQAKTKFEKNWNKINKNALTALSEVVEIDWPKEDKTIWARVSLNPICPRWIKKRIFDVYYGFTTHKMQEIAIHEILHFIYFEKWKEVFPNSNEKHFDAPHLIWQLSEMVPPIILSDKRIQKIIKHKPRAYKEYESAKINNKPLLSYFKGFYKKRKSFEDFLITSYSFVKKHKKEINEIK